MEGASDMYHQSDPPRRKTRNHARRFRVWRWRRTADVEPFEYVGFNIGLCNGETPVCVKERSEEEG